MKGIKELGRFHKTFICKKTKNICKSIKKQKTNKNITKDSIIIENSTDLSSNNLISLEERSNTIIDIPSLDDILIPSFLNDITKYKKINKEIDKYYQLRKSFESPEMAKVYLIDVKRLYEEKAKIKSLIG